MVFRYVFLGVLLPSTTNASDGLQPSDIIACMNDGILTITWPRSVANATSAMVVDSEPADAPRQTSPIQSTLHTVTPTSDLRNRAGRPSMSPESSVVASPPPDSKPAHDASSMEV